MISKAICLEPANKIKLIRRRKEASPKFKVERSPIVITAFTGCWLMKWVLKSTDYSWELDSPDYICQLKSNFGISRAKCKIYPKWTTKTKERHHLTSFWCLNCQLRAHLTANDKCQLDKLLNFIINTRYFM